jgi:HAD superfamily phosphatase (TIGR01668 family)
MTVRRRHWLRPDVMVPSVLDLTPERLAQWGVRGLVLDADNTLVPRNRYALTPEVHAWLDAVRASGVRCCILSNSASPRKVAAMVSTFDMPALSLARKPLAAGFRRALTLLGTTPAETAMVGDQVFTDILGGNRMGLLTVLVRPVSTNDFILYRLLGRTLERPLLRRWQGKIGDGALPEAAERAPSPIL